MSDLISREKLLNEINLLKKSPWYNKDFAAVKLVRKDAVAIVEKCVEEAPGVPQWISVKDRLPDKDGKYLVFGKVALSDIHGEPIQLVRFTERKEWLTSLSVKYWTYLPEPPKENDTE